MLGRRILAIIACFALAASAATAAEPLRVGMELSYPPFEMTDPQGRPTGVSVRLAEALAKHLGRPLVIENIAFDGLIPALKTGRIDCIISSLTATPERAKSIAFSEPYLRTGLALADALEPFCDGRITLKWPNDLQVAGRKLGGILIELQGDALGPSAAVIGIGINVRLPGEFVERLDQPAVDLHRAGGGDDRNLLLAALLRELADCIDGFASQGFAPFEQEYRARHALQGADVDIAMPDGSTVSGTVEGTNLDGSLRVATGRGLRSFHGGEVSVRRTPV
jgi:biotin-[acetyl-CoA-carboxylase] ligase BirA-like protein